MIETVSSDNSEGVLLRVLPDGRMTCWVDGVALQPTPAWLCRRVAIQAGIQQQQQGSDLSGELGGCPASPNPPGRTDDQLYREGIHILREAAPCSVQLSFAMLHAREEQSS